jgi:hypothetical protein
LIWTIGIIIDEFFTGKCFYQKFAAILNPKDNYEFRAEGEVGKIGMVLERMIVKRKDMRANFEEVERLFFSIRHE